MKCDKIELICISEALTNPENCSEVEVSLGNSLSFYSVHRMFSHLDEDRTVPLDGSIRSSLTNTLIVCINAIRQHFSSFDLTQ